MTVLTEAATGNYALTAPLAALAGADRVMLLSRDSRFGTAEQAIAQTRAIARVWGFDDRLDVLRDRMDPAIAAADIVTNLGFVRPIDRSLTRQFKKSAVVPLMFESWEYRAEDVDLQACHEAGIPVGGTDESHPAIGIFDYLGPVSLRLLFELDIEVTRSSILVVGGGGFAPPVIRTLQALGAKVSQFDPLTEDAPDADMLRGVDALLVLEHRSRDMLIDGSGRISVNALAEASPGVVVAHICGAIDAAALHEHGIVVHPANVAPAGYMSVRTDYVGPRPVIDLHAAGLRVGQALVEATRTGYHGIDAARHAASRCSLVQPLDLAEIRA